MSKENLIEEAIKTFYKEMVIVKGGGADSIGDPIPPYDELISQDPETYVDFIRSSLNKSLDQTREETIREVEDMLPLEYHPDGDSEKGYNACLGEIKITLNKLKK